MQFIYDIIVRMTLLFEQAIQPFWLYMLKGKTGFLCVCEADI